MSHSPVLVYILHLISNSIGKDTLITQECLLALVDLFTSNLTTLAKESISLSLSSSRTQCSISDIQTTFSLRFISPQDLISFHKTLIPFNIILSPQPPISTTSAIISIHSTAPHSFKNLPQYPSSHTYKHTLLTWRPDASSSSILLKRQMQIRQVEENLSRILLPTIGKYQKRLQKNIPITNENNFMVPHRDLSLVNYETSRFGIDGLIRKRKGEREEVLEVQDLDMDLVD